MVFSKTFGYALRGVLYVALMDKNTNRVPLQAISQHLGIPKPFLGKVMKRLVQAGILSSQRGPGGGFYLLSKTLESPLTQLLEVFGELDEFSKCVLHFKSCNEKNPCPLHEQSREVRAQWFHLLRSVTLGDLIKNKLTPELNAVLIDSSI
ncbi:MAG: Rrf2 family transcriptional regulator [Saprospiraceae bacterium]